MCFYFVVCISIFLQDDKISGKDGKSIGNLEADPHGGEDVEKMEGAKVCDNHFFNQFEYGVIIFAISFQIVEKVFRRKVVLQDELPDEALFELDIEVIEKSIIVVPASESVEVL